MNLRDIHSGLSFTVLGSVGVRCGDEELSAGPPERRSLLGLLPAQAGLPMAVHDIVDALWGEEPMDRR